MDNNVKNILKYLISVTLAALLLFVCFRGIGWKDFTSALSSCRWGWVAASMLIGAAGIFLRGLRWQMLITPTDRSTKVRTCFNAISISYVANMALPRLGEFVRCGYITRSSAKGPDGKKLASYDKIIGTVVLERSLDALTLLTVLALTMVLTWRRFGSFFNDTILSGLGSRSIPWILPVLGIFGLLTLGAVWLLRGRFTIFQKILNVFSGIWQGVASCIHMKRGWLFVILTLGIWCCYWLMAATTIWAIQGSGGEGSAMLDAMGMTDALFLMVVGSVSSFIPVPGGFGAYHYLISLALTSVYGVPMASGLAFATLSHESQTLIQIICGTASYIDETWGKE